jgi:O-acetylserine/cysteine efflux transporter
VVVQAGVLKGRDPVAVTAVQMLAGALAAVPNAALEGLPAAPHGATPVLALAALATVGTLAPFALFAYGQSQVAPELAGAFLNLEPLVGAAAGALAFGDPFGAPQLTGALAIVLGIALSTRPSRTADPTPSVRPSPSAARRHGGRVHVSRRHTAPLSDMTLLAPHPARTTAPRVYMTPVVREVPSAPAATGSSSAW